MKATLEMINRMQADGVIGKYAIGGAVGATFYFEPVATADVDIFVMMSMAPGSVLLSLKKHGLISQWEKFKNRYVQR